MRVAGLAVLLGALSRVAAADPTLAQTRDQLDTQRRDGCRDSCCLAPRAWFEDAVRTPAELALARAELARPSEPRSTALAVRVLAPAAGLGDVPALAKLVDDKRAGGELPAIVTSQAVERCYAVSWAKVTVAGEALAALSRIDATYFDGAAAYRAWAAAHRDPEATFDYWYAHIVREHPPDPDLVARLRTRDPVLIARVIAAYCAGDADCGVPDLDDLLRRGVPADRALRWLALDDRFPEWQNPDLWAAVTWTLMVHGEAIFSAGHVAALERLYRAKKLPTYGQAHLAVLIGRLAPASAPRIWTDALRELTSSSDRRIVLEEAAAREPVGFADTLAKHFTSTGAIAILDGLARAGPPAAATFARLVALHPIDPEDQIGVRSLVTAARAIGCAHIPEPTAMMPHPLKGSSPDQQRDEDRRSRQARVDGVAAVRACLGR